MKLLLINYLVYGVLLSAVGVSCYSACKDWQPHPSGNCREYIRCVGDSAYVKRCPSTLYFNPILRVCDWPWNVTCGSMSNVTKPPERPPTTPEYVIPPNRPFACPKGVQWGRFPDLESNCQEFYECDRGRCSMGRCPNGLLFNILIISCDLPENTVCPNFRTQPICASSTYVESPYEGNTRPRYICVFSAHKRRNKESYVTYACPQLI